MIVEIKITDAGQVIMAVTGDASQPLDWQAPLGHFLWGGNGGPFNGFKYIPCALSMDGKTAIEGSGIISDSLKSSFEGED